ncbi:MAG TPA: ATP-grasp domain-containing protein [Acidimicrobiales bacterium]|nr:ATP-grasp domain-containing protein [Acidimicrobiales bacterium]
MRRILVTGVGGPAGRSLSRQLVVRGHTVVAVDMAPIDLDGMRVEQVPAANDPRFVDELTAIADWHDVDLVLPTVTEELVVLAGGADMLHSGPRAPVVVAPLDAVTIANDKLLTCQHLAAAGVAVPAFTLPSAIASAVGLERLLGMPYLSKPRVGRGGRHTTVHHAAERAHLAQPDDSLLLQEFIPGVEYAPNLYLGRDPAEDVVVVLAKTALANGLVGNALSVERTTAPDVADVARRACRAIGLRGPVDLDIRRRADGTPVVLEINARFGANSAHAPEVLDQLLAEHVLAMRA